MPSTAPTSPIRSSTAASRCVGCQLLVLAQPLHLVHHRVLRLLLPVEQEHVLPEVGQVRVGLDALAVVQLREQFDVERQPEHRPRRRTEHRLRDVVGLRQELVAGRHALARHLLEAAEHLLVLQFLVGEAHEGFERDLVAEPVLPAHLEDLGADEALDQAEDVGVGAALDLAEVALLQGSSGRPVRSPSTGRPAGTSCRSRSGVRGRRPCRCPSGRAWRPRRTSHSGWCRRHGC